MKQYLFFLIVVVISCNMYKESDSNLNSFELKETNLDIRFPLDENTGLILQSLQLFKSGDSIKWLTFLNSYNNSIYYYDFNKKELLKKIEFPKFGPLGVGNVNGFYLHSLDSLFLVSRDNYQITMVINPLDSLRTQTSIDLTNGVEELSTAKPLGYTGNRIILIDNKLYVLGVPDFDPASSSFMDHAKNLHIIDLIDFSLLSKSIYSEEYSNIWPIHYLVGYSAHLEQKNEMIFSLPAANEIIRYKPNGESLLVDAKSKYVEKINAMKTREYTGQSRDQHYYRNASYHLIHYDNFRDLFYRFVELPNEKAIEEDHPSMASKIPSIVLLNSKFEKVGETRLEAQHFFSDMSFVDEDGLYLSQPLLDNGLLNEEVLRFVLFKPVAVSEN